MLTYLTKTFTCLEHAAPAEYDSKSMYEISTVLQSKIKKSKKPKIKKKNCCKYVQEAKVTMLKNKEVRKQHLIIEKITIYNLLKKSNDSKKK